MGSGRSALASVVAQVRGRGRMYHSLPFCVGPAQRSLLARRTQDVPTATSSPLVLTDAASPALVVCRQGPAGQEPTARCCGAASWEGADVEVLASSTSLLSSAERPEVQASGPFRSMVRTVRAAFALPT